MEIVKNQLLPKPLTTGQVLENVSYGKISGQPSRILQSEGFKTALSEIGLKEALIAEGINSQKIAEKINVLLNGVDKEGGYDYNAIDKGLKHAKDIYGILDNESKNTTNVYNFINNPTFQEKIKNYDSNYKTQILNVQKTQTIKEDVDTSE